MMILKAWLIRRGVQVLLSLAVGIGAFVGPAAAERRALVIGNNNYVNFTYPLKTAIADAQAIANQLDRLHFKVIYRENLDKNGMVRALDDFSRQLLPEDVAVFYFAGHGVQTEDGVNYLLPIDVRRQEGRREVDDLRDQGILLGPTLAKISRQRPRFSLAIIDACRIDPLSPRIRSPGLRGGLAPITPATGMMVVYSAGINQVAVDQLSDGDRDPNGLFVRELLKYISQPISIKEMMERVKLAVIAKARAYKIEQTPAIYDQYTGEFYFIEPGMTSLPAIVNPPQSPPSSLAMPKPRPVPSPPTAPSQQTSPMYTDSQGCNVIAGIRSC